MTADDLDEALRALAHPDRRKFITACLGQQRAAGELADLTSLSLATVSEHLKVLRKTGLVTLEVDGRYRLYKTDRAKLAAVIRALRGLNRR